MTDRSPDPRRRPTTRTLWQLSGLLVFGALIVTACSRESCETGCALCGGAVMLGSKVVDSIREEDRQLEACGECPSGTICNLLYEPAQCRPRPGKLGDRCGRWKRSSQANHNFFCSSKLHCSHDAEIRLCSEPAEAGLRCMADVECRPGLYCSRAAGRICVEQLDTGEACTRRGECREGQECSADHRCSPRAPTEGPGAPTDADLLVTPDADRRR